LDTGSQQKPKYEIKQASKQSKPQETQLISRWSNGELVEQVLLSK
jgi:hypothetical protein